MSRTNKQVESFAPAFDGAGNVTALSVTVSYNLVDDIDNDMVGRRRTVDIWPQLTPAQKTAAQTSLQRFLQVAQTIF